MAENYGLGDLSFAGITINGAGTPDKLKLTVWNGSFGVSVVRDKEQKSAVWKTMNSGQRQILQDCIDHIIKAGPETSRPIVFSTYNRDTRKYDTDWVFELYKDSKMIYHIKINTRDCKFDFIIKGPSGVSFGNDPMSEAQKSEYGLKDILSWLRHTVPTQIILSNKRKDPSQFQRGGQRSNGTASAPQNYETGSSIDNEYF